MASQLIPYPVPDFKGGYDSYSASKSNIQDNEIPIGQNVELDDNGSVSKMAGSVTFGAQVASGHAITGMGNLLNTTYNAVITSSNTSWYAVNGIAGTTTALTGKTFGADLDTDYCQALDKLYGGNGTDNLCYTSDSATVVEITSNGNIGRFPTFYNQRIYMTNSTYPDRIYYSNPYALDDTTNPPTLTGFDDGNMFNTDLSHSPKRNAGFFILQPGSGVQISSVFPDGNYLYLYTKKHGTWQVGAIGTANTDGSISHSIQQVSRRGNSPAARSIIKNLNDQWFYNEDGYYSYGEVATYQSPRQSIQSGRVKSEFNSVAVTGKTRVVAIPFKEKVIIAYQVGSYNDRIVKFDNRLNAYSAPRIGINASCFLEYVDNNNARRLLAGSSNPASSFIYEIETGTSYGGTAIQSNFETKSFDCGKPGLVKRIGFIDVFYALLVGQITYYVYADETTLVATDSIQIGSSANSTSGIGSKLIGSFLIGQEFTTSNATIQTNSTFRIDCGFTACKRVSVKIVNNNLSEQFKIDSMVIYYLPGSIYEQ